MSTTGDPVHTVTEKSTVRIADHKASISQGSSNVPERNIAFQPAGRYQTRHSLDLDDYFAGPRDMQKHSKLPFFMRVHGSVTPKILLPLTFVGVWATAVTCVSKFVHNLGIDTVLLTVLGFVVAFGLSFRCSTGYERYSDGRKYWAQLTLTSRNMGRLIWLNINERKDPDHPEYAKQDLLGKISAINLINAFALALKHRLRFEPAVDYPDISNLVGHLDGTMARHADQSKLRHQKPSLAKRLGENLGVPMAKSNPRELIKHSTDNLGNLPHEILAHLSAYADKCINEDKNIATACCQNLIYSDIRSMADILTGVERVRDTPLPLAYSISISQITWVYIMVLPFQLYSKLQWITIPATIVAAYIILGLAIIGREIEDPFGNDVNDLPLEMFCTEIAADLDVLTSTPAHEYKKFINGVENRPLFPLSYGTVSEWQEQTIDDIRAALRAKATTSSHIVQIQRTRTGFANIETA